MEFSSIAMSTSSAAVGLFPTRYVPTLMRQTYNSRAMKLLLTSLLFLFASATQAIACSCAGDARPCEAYGDASAIFVGTVTLSTNITVKEVGHELTQMC